MGIAIPQVITSDRASGAQVIDGSLNFFQDQNPYLEFTPGSDGNRSTWTISFWALVYPNETGTYNPFTLSTSDNYAWEYEGLHYASNNLYYIDYISQASGANILWRTNAEFRDTGWYHFMAVKVNNSTFKLYVNGEEQTSLSSSTNNGNQSSHWNKSGQKMFLGGAKFTNEFSSHSPGMSQFYFIDGQALDPTDFAFTDPLTNTWKPKKYTGTFTGTNTCYLPFDGNSPIGQDQSGNGNNWTPINFFSGGSVTLDKATGARPILNTTHNGTHAAPGVFGSKEGFREVVSSSSGGGNPYIFVTRGTQPTLSFIRGATYIFDYSGATSHPLRFATAADAAGSTQYTDGTSVSGNVISFTVPHNAPDTLYYYCTNHSGMGNSISVTTDETKADPYAWKCVLACPLVGSNIDVSNQINCTSTTKVMTTEGNAYASGNTNQFYGGSFEFDGTGDGITTPDNTDFEFGSGEFTIECWVKQDDTSSFDQFVGKYGGSGNGEYIVGKNGNTPTFYWTDAGGNNFMNATNFRAPSTVSGLLDAWYHMACVRKGDVFTMYINGICENSTTDATTLATTSNKLTIGVENDLSSSAFDGYLQDVRIYKGAAKYSGTTIGTQYFVPPSRNPDILPDTPSGVSGGSKLTKITDGAVSFNGSDQYLSIADNADFTVGSDPFTIEFYAYKTASGEDFFCGSSDSGGQTVSMSYSVQTGGGSPSNSLRAHVGDGTSLYTVNSGIDFLLDRWVHVAFVRDGNTLRLFQDGIQMDTTSFSGTVKDSADPFMIGRGFGADSVKNFPGFISNFRFIKGTALYTSNFPPPSAPLTNVTNTKLLCCQSPTSATEAAVSPSTPTNGGSSVASNFTPFNTDINTFRGQESGYATLNPLTNYIESSTYTLPVISDGNLTVKASTTRFSGVCGDVFATSGKFYAEVTKVSGQTTDDSIGFGARTFQPSLDGNVYIGRTSDSYGFYGSGGSGGAGRKIHNNSFSDYGSSWGAVGDVMGLLMDLDNGTFSLAINNINQGVAYSSIDASLGWTFTVAPYNNQKYKVNFGQKPFKYAPPDGFQPLNAANVRPVKVISRPDQYVGVSTWSGDSSERQIVTGNAPDFVWIKADADDEHVLADSVRGGGFVMSSSAQNKQADFSTPAHWGSVKSFDDNGFTVQTGAGGYHRVNLSGRDYAAWCWKAGGSKNTFNVDNVGYSTYTTAPGLDAGTIKIMGASVGTKQGFSIIKYRGNSTANATLPHGLSEAPNFVIIKNMSNDYGWAVLHTEAGTTGTTLDGSPEYYMLQLDSAASIADWSADTIWNPTSTTVKIDQTGGANWVNNSNSEYIAYLWHDVPGLQKFGEYDGNGDADGPYVELGFRPAAVIVKYAASSGSASWFMYNSERGNSFGGKFNPTNDTTMPDRTAANQQAYDIDFLSNGFKLRYADNAGYTNYDAKYVYMAWAESPTVDLYGGGANAR